jgi:hypothetical protein
MIPDVRDTAAASIALGRPRHRPGESAAANRRGPGDRALIF